MCRMLSFLFPEYCVGCQKTGSCLCDDCLSKLSTHSEICPYCKKFSRQGVTCRECREIYPDGLDGIIVGFRYHKSIKKAIHQLKYRHASAVAPRLAHQLGLHLVSHLGYGRMGSILLTDVPNHRRRRRMTKGYNQSTLLARSLAKEFCLPFVSLSKRTKNTTQQTKLSRGRRRDNLSGVFVTQNVLVGRIDTIIIVDDVSTTGSTLHHVCNSIKRSYPEKKVRGLVVARQGK